MKKQGNTLFHLNFKSTGKDHYFGSIAAIYDRFTAKDLGVGRTRLYDFDIEEDKPYSNKICTIKKSVLHRKPGNRRGEKKLTKKVVNISRSI